MGSGLEQHLPLRLSLWVSGPALLAGPSLLGVSCASWFTCCFSTFFEIITVCPLIRWSVSSLYRTWNLKTTTLPSWDRPTCSWWVGSFYTQMDLFCFSFVCVFASEFGLSLCPCCPRVGAAASLGWAAPAVSPAVGRRLPGLLVAPLF